MASPVSSPAWLINKQYKRGLDAKDLLYDENDFEVKREAE